MPIARNGAKICGTLPRAPFSSKPGATRRRFEAMAFSPVSGIVLWALLLPVKSFRGDGDRREIFYWEGADTADLSLSAQSQRHLLLFNACQTLQKNKGCLENNQDVTKWR
jgi:hypothetical protein